MNSNSDKKEIFVNVTLKMPLKLYGKLTKKAIKSKDIQIIAADWDNIREIWKT